MAKKKKARAKAKPKAKAKKAAKKAAKKTAKKAPKKAVKRTAGKTVKKAAKEKRPAVPKKPAAKPDVAAAPPADLGMHVALSPAGTLGGVELEIAVAPVTDAVWYRAESSGDGVMYRFAPGTLSEMAFLSADLLLDGRRLGVFNLTLQEGESGPKFNLSFALLPQVSARMRARLEAVNQNRWRYDREGAWLKPLCGGDRVDLARVDRMTITVGRKGEEPVRWCMTDVTASVGEPARMSELVLPAGQVIDELGQAATYDWPGKSRSPLEVTARLEEQLASAEWQKWPERWSQYGGSRDVKFDATGYFRTHHDGTRWWLVDPEGCAFWSAGCDCVRVDTNAAFEGLEDAIAWMPGEDAGYAAAYGARGKGGARTVNFLAANFIRAFGPEKWYESWGAIALAHLKRLGFNTVANWSDWKIARDASFPYVRPLDLSAISALPKVFRDFPDVFAPEFEPACAEYSLQLRETASDPALVGYFLMNEPTWGFAKGTPAAGMLFNAPACPARSALAEFLKERHVDDAGLSRAWGIETSLNEIASAGWTKALTDAAQEDLAGFSEVMCEKLFQTLSIACKAVDPNHLNLGARYYTVPPAWAVKGMRHFDVFSMNCYRDRVPADEFTRVAQLLERPVMVGEWHFGAHDVGLPASGIGRVKDQAARGEAFRFYTEDAAAKPECVGVHYFTLYDQSALGRFDGECYNIGFLDVCNRPYEELAGAARHAHERLYGVASGAEPPTEQRPEYLEKLFL